ncbi:MAG: NAD(P)H-dependent oxidoreductase [Patescibacteria group bacterium]
MAKKIFVLLGHPDTDTLSGAFADAYEAGALAAGHEVRRQSVGEMQFDPILYKGYKVIQALEPDLVTFQSNVRWADHLVIVYPNWWATMPALLKGLIDRAWLPGFAFNFRKDGRPGWIKRLKGKSARIIISANVNPWAEWFLFGDFTNELARATLGFSGIAPVRISIFTPAETASKTRQAWWIRKVKELGMRAR